MESTRKVFAMHEEHGNMLLANKRRRLRLAKYFFCVFSTLFILNKMNVVVFTIITNYEFPNGNLPVELSSFHQFLYCLNRKLKLYFSHEAENGLQEVTAKLQDVVNADQGLEDVSETVKNLCGFAHSTLCFSEAEITSLQEGFCCLVCRSEYF